MHDMTPDLLAWACHQLKRQAAPGIDGMTWEEYPQPGRIATGRRCAVSFVASVVGEQNWHDSCLAM